VVSPGLNIHKEALAERYLGLPTEVGRNTAKVFEYLLAQVKGRIESWCGREASCAGREILIKSIAQAVPTYSMSYFLLPVNTCKKMKSAIANYWWGSSVDNRKMHWMSWERLNQPKCKGGMGFRDIRCFNLAMLGKQGWWLIIRPDSLCARILKGIYYHDMEFMRATREKHASSTWRAILAGHEALQHGLIRRVVNGESIEIWRDRWILDHFGARPITSRGKGHLVLVSELLQDGSWNEGLLQNFFLPIDVAAIKKQPIGRGDSDYWA
jgi:hypothetical protein